jgi:hypothetical protein
MQTLEPQLTPSAAGIAALDRVLRRADMPPVTPAVPADPAAAWADRVRVVENVSREKPRPSRRGSADQK